MNQIEFYETKLAYEIDSWDLSVLIKNQENIVVIDTRSKSFYDMENIPTSINLPHSQMTEETTKEFDKTKLYITYCDGIGCNGSTKGALNMAKLGFRVKELLGGLDWWKRDGHETKGTSGQKAQNLSCGC